MDQKPRFMSAKSLFLSLVVGWSLLCATPLPSYSEKAETAQIVKGMIIDQFGRFPVGSDATVKVSEEKGKVILSIRCEGGKIATTRTFPLTDRSNSGWFVYVESNREFWSFDGDKKGWSWEWTTDAANSTGAIFTIGKVLSDRLPHGYAERIIQTRATKPKAPDQ